MTRVAPLAGAWIETEVTGRAEGSAYVAPLAGAWIETSSSFSRDTAILSHPSRVRGLKQLLILSSNSAY